MNFETDSNQSQSETTKFHEFWHVFLKLEFGNSREKKIDEIKSISAFVFNNVNKVSRIFFLNRMLNFQGKRIIQNKKEFCLLECKQCFTSSGLMYVNKFPRIFN